MPIAEEPALRAICLAENDVSDRLKTRLFPCLEESIDLRPAVEHDGYAILLQYPVCFVHSGLEPVGFRVVLDSASIAVTVVHQIRGVGEDEIDAVCSHLTHDLDAVALRDAVDEPILNCSLCLHGLDLLCGPGVISQDTLPEGARDGRSQDPAALFRKVRKIFPFSAFFAGFCRKDFLKAEKAETRSVAGRGLSFSRGA